MTSAPRLSLLASTVLTLALASIGCGGETSDTAPTTGGTAGTSGTSGSAGTTAGSSGTAGTAAGTAGTGGTAGAGGTAGTTAGTSGTAGAPGGNAGTAGDSSVGGDAGSAGSGGAPNDSQCHDDSDCLSGSCYVVGSGQQSIGLCGECKMDADCASTTGGGCTLPNPLGDMPKGAVCNHGEAGGNCETDTVCSGDLVCGVVVHIQAPMFDQTIRSCGSCNDMTACDGDKICSPSFDLHTLVGQNDCVEPASVASGQGCPFDSGQGNDAVCTDGHCTELKASAMGFSIGLGIGVCGECAGDSDCGMGGHCTDANAALVDIQPVVIGDVTGSTCGGGMAGGSGSAGSSGGMAGSGGGMAGSGGGMAGSGGGMSMGGMP